MSKHPQPKPATDAAQALHDALGAWLSDDINAEPVDRSRALDALTGGRDAFSYEVLWERRRLVFQMRDQHTLAQISDRIGHHVSALHQWMTGDRRASATGRFVGQTTKPAFVLKRKR